MGLRAADILWAEHLVEIDRGIYVLHNVGRGGGKPPAPHFVGGFLSHKLCSGRRPGLKRIQKVKVKSMSEDKSSAGPSLSMALGILGLSALIGFAAVYVTLGGSDNGASHDKSVKTQSQAKKSKRLGADHGGDLAAFVKKSSPAALANITFEDGSGKPKSLADFRGKTILLNFWATWCAPCKAEMPSLDRLQSQLGSDKFEVVAVALDHKGRNAAQTFLDATKSDNLKLYIDPTAKAGSALNVVGMPVTILIDPEGREIGRLVGPAEWDSPAAIALIKAAL